MEKEFANYDLVDRVISNERKARSWTLFWITLLCIMGGILIWALVSILEKNKTIKDHIAIVKMQRDSILNMDSIINSLNVSWERSMERYTDSLRKEVDSTLNSIAKMETTTNPSLQKEKAIAINTSIQKLNQKLQEIKKDFQKEKLRIFIHYNYSPDRGAVNNLVNTLNSKNDYLVLPPELIRAKFAYLIKCFNYENAKKESWLKKNMAGGFAVKPENIVISH
ncbi:MAG: hypothetical protein ABIN74_10170, partial [Ferruginibacter sp.]